MKKYIRVITIGMLSMLLFGGGYAARHHWVPSKAAAAIDKIAAPKKPVYSVAQKAMFDDLISVCHRMDSLDNYTLRGTMMAHDPADSANQLNTSFEMVRRGKEFYYRLGNQEMVALQNVYVVVDNTIKKMAVMNAREVALPKLMQNAPLAALWQEESYAIASDTANNQVSIRLLCERHATCKEFKISYDPANRVISSAYMRFTDINDPLNKDKDKTVAVTVTSLEMLASPARLDRFRYVSGSAGHWQAARQYAGYEININ